MENDKLIIGKYSFDSRFILGSGKFSLNIMENVIKSSGTEMVTVALRRANIDGLENILDYIPKNITILPNTSGARNADEAIRIANLTKHLGCGDLIKLEVIRDNKYLLPDNYQTLKATEFLANNGFTVMPYIYPDLNIARDLYNAGAAAIMPLAAPIGSNRGLLTIEFIKILIEEIKLPIIIDAGIGRPSEACHAMELGVDAIMANTSISTSKNILLMASAFKNSIIAGRQAYLSVLGRIKQFSEASSPLIDFLED